MSHRSEKVLKAFLSRCPATLRSSLERFLSDQERNHLEKVPFFDEGSFDVTYAQAGTLDSIHWSWIVPVLESYPLREQRLYIAALNEPAASRIGAFLDLDRSEKLTEIARPYLREELFRAILGENQELLPPAFLPTSRLNALLDFSKKNLTRLIDLLALYDLSVEFRQIVETKILKKIYSFLTDEQKEILKQIPVSSEGSPFGKLGLDRWDETYETLHSLLHRRGLTRLGSALYGQEPDFIWMISRKLDIGRGNVLLKLCRKESSADIAPLMQKQLEELMDKL